MKDRASAVAFIIAMLLIAAWAAYVLAYTNQLAAFWGDITALF